LDESLPVFPGLPDCPQPLPTGPGPQLPGPTPGPVPHFRRTDPGSLRSGHHPGKELLPGHCHGHGPALLCRNHGLPENAAPEPGPMNNPPLVLGILAHFFMISGCLIMFLGVLGTIFLGDLFQRFHASTKSTVSGAMAILVGLSLWSGNWSFILKFLVILIFLVFTAPIVAHMLAISRLGKDALDSLDEQEVEP